MELSEEGWIALGLRYAWALPAGRERVSAAAGVEPELAAEFGVERFILGKYGQSRRNKGPETHRLSEIRRTI